MGDRRLEGPLPRNPTLCEPWKPLLLEGEAELDTQDFGQLLEECGK